MLLKIYPTALRLLHQIHSGYTEILNFNTVQKKKPHNYSSYKEGICEKSD